ncbi:uncharacterized protein EV420DRAFT_479289 [Desarmillaria tabescens]|uniref:Uncharacterized protein n=1 Tax=Armillaria tabescens TaxID=1929756 RepID=A0AA39KBK5_ARMTA|nr:uncharacterized protein EV420DRAFT_479289 [Desarmillaria tabescens]KAK0457808.1 hypothetical protein EV420DRAFT_479289 [Desarmillaria tabescens]
MLMDTDIVLHPIPKRQLSSNTHGYLPDFPPELLHIIFWYATRTPRALERARREASYVPFQDSGWKYTLITQIRARKEDWEVKTAISLVCKTWNSIVTEFVFEEITIGPCAPSLEMLDMFGHWVRRLELQPVETENCSIRLIDILSRCPRLEILAKLSSADLDSPKFWSGFNDYEPPSLHCLRRVDWTSSHPDCGPEVCHASESAFMSIVAHAPNLNHLSSSSTLLLGKLFDKNEVPLSPLNIIRFPVACVDHLRLNPSSEPLCPMPRPFRVPCLTHVIIDNAVIHSLCHLSQLPQFPQVAVLELQDGVFLEATRLSILFHVFPKCEELALPAGHAHIINHESSRHAAKKYYASIKRIRLFASPFGPLRSLNAWMKVHAHVLFTECFPAVDTVFLHGDWRFTVTAQLLRGLKSMLHERSCWLVYENGSPVVS